MWTRRSISGNWCARFRHLLHVPSAPLWQVADRLDPQGDIPREEGPLQGACHHDKEYDWKEYPVIHLDMANCNAKNAVRLKIFFLIY
jgi:hypothetical protein